MAAFSSYISAQYTYDEQRIIWRRSLNEAIVRELAAEYLRGSRDEDVCDGFAEFEQRFGKYTAGESLHPRKSKKAQKSSYR